MSVPGKGILDLNSIQKLIYSNVLNEGRLCIRIVPPVSVADLVFKIQLYNLISYSDIQIYISVGDTNSKCSFPNYNLAILDQSLSNFELRKLQIRDVIKM